MRRAVVVGFLVALLLATGSGGGTQTNPCAGTVKEPAEGLTVISTQGAKMGEGLAEKRPARLVGVGPRGRIRWVYHAGREQGIVWSYDVDPLDDGTLFVTATRKGESVFFVLDPQSGEVIWEETLPLVDTHDADLLDEHRILIANMRNYDPATDTNNDRLVIYNRTSDEYVWEWRFDEHYPRKTGRNYSDDWTHVNDVDRIAPGKYLASVRNFDQVIVVDRDSSDIVRRLGRDDRFSVMHEQHNPQYLESGSGRPTFLIADSGNDRIVEYDLGPLGWTKTWELGSNTTLNWPRDADRLPDGNTLVTDSINNRVIEVTPDGEIVWEFYAPWLVYEAERVAYGDEAGGPTISDQEAGGSYSIRNGQPRSTENQTTCASFLARWTPATQASPTPTASPHPPSTPTTNPTRSAGPGDPNPGTTASTPATQSTTPGQPGFGVVALLLVLLVLAGATRRQR